MKGKRSGIEFDQHELIVTKTDDLTVYRLKKPDTYTESMRFINVMGVLVVTGDWGNWIFCREFHPSADKNAGCSDGYWCEKLQISSTQQPYEYDPEATLALINERLNNPEEELDEADREYLRQCRDRHDERYEYLEWAHNNLPNGRDHEYVPNRQRVQFWLQVVFDGFDEICRRMREQSSPPIKQEDY
jgi:hypothetical protein